jgi:predicted metal-binding membrane protein
MSMTLMMSPAMMALNTVVMMVAMMLPSFAPSLWRYHRRLRAMRLPRTGQQTLLYGVGYASVWTAISLALFVLGAERFPMGASSATGVALLCAGALQCSRWKANQLVRCRQTMTSASPTVVMSAWRDGCRLGVDCALSCAAPMAALVATGVMDTRMMAAIGAMITAERVAPSGARIARLTGALALVTGALMCV